MQFALAGSGNVCLRGRFSHIRRAVGLPLHESDSITAHLRVSGREVTQVLQPGEDISVRVHGLELIVGVRAVEDDRLLLESGVPHGSRASLTLAEQ
jgi:hypothetical protein